MKERYKRQGFLGEKAQEVIESKCVGVIGLGGGGSHIVQQLAHIGFKNYVLVDFDVIEKSNLNRLVGATLKDVEDKKKKSQIASRMILGLQPDADIVECDKKWQFCTDELRACDIIFTCLDSLGQRDEIERFSRAEGITIVDIGMVVKQEKDEAPYISGQVISSIPGKACFRCLDFVTDENLAKEDEGYGDVGEQPQVIWPNGSLASTAIGVGMELLTGWTGTPPHPVHLTYDGNKFLISPSLKMRYQSGELESCEHF